MSDLAAIKARLAAATQGKWRVGGIAYNNVVLAHQDEPDYEVGYEGMWPVYPTYGPKDDREPEPQESANLHFIANAPDDIRKLLAIVERQQKFMLGAAEAIHSARQDKDDTMGEYPNLWPLYAELEHRLREEASTVAVEAGKEQNNG